MILASCICPTYGRCPDRQRLLEECVQSFLLQTYPRKELLILNDCPAQKLVCDVPGVRVINWHHRFESLGAKYNLLVGLAAGEAIFPWEDDDVCLPHRVAQGVERLAGGVGYFNPQGIYYWEKGQAPRRDPGGVCHNASCYLKEAWLKIGGYPPTSGAQDLLFDRVLRELVRPAPALRPDERPTYVYRWFKNDHLSGYKDTLGFYRSVGQRSMQAGEFVLRPQWDIDYDRATAEIDGR